MRLRISPTARALLFSAGVAFLVLAGSFVVARRTATRVLWSPDLRPVEMSFSPRWWRPAPDGPSRLIVWRAWACDADGVTCCFPPSIELSARGEILRKLPAETESAIERSRSPAGLERALVNVVLSRIEGRLPDRDSLLGLPDSLQGFSEVEVDLMAAFTAHGDISHAGHDYWYRHNGRAQTLRAAEAFARLGELPAADAMRRSLDAFPGGTPTREYLDAHSSELKGVFAPLDMIVSHVNFNGDAARYIQAKDPELLAADPGLTKAVARLRAPR